MIYFSRRQFFAGTGLFAVDKALAQNFSAKAFEMADVANTASTAGKSYQDGFAEAVKIPAQYPSLLANYAVRPPWHVAGVDYGVGLSPNHTLVDWKTLAGRGISVSDTYIRIDNTAGVIFDSVDFSLHGGCQVLFINSPGGVLKHCKFGGRSYPQLSTAPIHCDAASPGITVRHCTIDGGSLGGKQSQTCLIYAIGGGDVVLEYNWLKNYATQILDVNTSSVVKYRFNLIDECIISNEAHSNVLQWISGRCAPTVEFNTYKQSTATRGEGFQFAFNSSGTFVNAVCSHNTMIATGAVSYLIHGSSGSRGTTLVGRPVASNNYFDLKGAYGAFYPRSFLGWDLSDNFNMRTGRGVG